MTKRKYSIYPPQRPLYKSTLVPQSVKLKRSYKTSIIIIIIIPIIEPMLKLCS